MIDLYTWKTPNGRKISIMLEEVGLDYEVHPININEGEQHQKHFLPYPEFQFLSLMNQCFERQPSLIY